MKKKKDPVVEFERMVGKRAAKLAKFNNEYEDMVEFDEIEINQSLREIVESGDITGNLGKLW